MLRCNKNGGCTYDECCVFNSCRRVSCLACADKGNVLEVEVTNLGANRLRWNDLNGVDWKYFSDINMVGMDYKKLDASKWKPLPSGLLTPVWVMATVP